MTLEENPELRATAGSHHHRRRRRQAQSARAGDHQHRQGGREGPVCIRAGQQPARGGKAGDREHRRNENRGDPVGQSLRVGLLRLRLLHQPDHSGESGVSADRGGLDDQSAVEHHGAADHAAAGMHPDRCRLARHGAHIDGGSAVDDQSVGGDGLPRPHREALLLLEFVGGDDHFGAVGQQHRHALGTQRSQRPQRAARLGLRARLEVAPGQHEDGHTGGHFQIDGVAAH